MTVGLWLKERNSSSTLITTTKIVEIDVNEFHSTRRVL
jgi:hypothetical protein